MGGLLQQMNIRQPYHPRNSSCKCPHSQQAIHQVSQFICTKSLYYILNLITYIICCYAVQYTLMCLCRFMGHGSGSKYLKPREVCQTDCRAAVLLMGCSSGAFDARGSMEPSGITLDYHIASWLVSHSNTIPSASTCTPSPSTPVLSWLGLACM